MRIVRNRGFTIEIHPPHWSLISDLGAGETVRFLSDMLFCTATRMGRCGPLVFTVGDEIVATLEQGELE